MNAERGLVKFIVEQQTRLSCIIRYNNTPKVVGESVAEHSYYVALMTMLISDYLETRHNVKVDKLKLMKMALLHDVEEIVSGDIIKVLKGGGFGAELEKMNERSMQHIITVLNSEHGEKYYALWHEAKIKEGSTESMLVDFADWLAVISYSIKEVHLGNEYFREILEFAVKSILKFAMKMPELKLLLREVADYAISYLMKEKNVVADINAAVRIYMDPKDSDLAKIDLPTSEK